MRRFMMAAGTLLGLAAGGVVAWRSNPRIGTRLLNDVANPFLVRRGISGGRRSELGTLEHVGRRTGTRRLTPVHPVPTEGGFRISVPLGPRSEWARNVLAAGRCRLQLHDTVYELDKPRLVEPAVADVPKVARWVAGPLGFQHLLLERLAERSGTLEPEEPTGPRAAGAPESHGP